MQRRTFLLGAMGTALAACGGKGGQGAPAPSSTAITTLPPTTVPTLSPSTTLAAPTTSSPTARFITRGADTSAQVALTFHVDGDPALAQRLLDTVRGRAQITCFVIGSWLDSNPTFARKFLDAGHEVANHTYSHLTFANLPAAQMASEITKCRDVLVRLAGTPGRFFRMSGTDDGLTPPPATVMAEATKAGYLYVLGWDVEPNDYKAPGRDAVRQRVTAGVKAGSIVSLHFGHAGTVDALPAILDELDRRGLKAVTASTLLGLR